MSNVTTQTILGRHTIVRHRVSKKRPVSITSGKCYRAFHAGRWSIYVAKSTPAKAVNISINDR
jgi:hypothetical protein